MGKQIIGWGLVLLICGCSPPDVRWTVREVGSKQGKILVFEEPGIYVLLEAFPVADGRVSSPEEVKVGGSGSSRRSTSRGSGVDDDIMVWIDAAYQDGVFKMTQSVRHAVKGDEHTYSFEIVDGGTRFVFTDREWSPDAQVGGGVAIASDNSTRVLTDDELQEVRDAVVEARRKAVNEPLK